MSFDRLLNGVTNRIERVVVLNSTGAAITGVAAASVTVAYRTDNQSAWTTVTLVAGTLGTYVSGSWVEDQNGSYQLCLPAAAYSVAGATQLYWEVSGITGQVPTVMEYQRELGVINPQNAANQGMTALPTAAAGAANGLAIVGSQMDLVNAPNAAALTAMGAAFWNLLTSAITLAGSFGLFVKSLFPAAGYTAPPTSAQNASAAATAILKTPSQPIATDSNGSVKANNIPGVPLT